MEESLLYKRLRTHCILAEDPADVPDARFALPSTIHWMRALALLAADLPVDFAAARSFYRAALSSLPRCCALIG
jgi:hypothetical protein